jgi:type VI secretion system secreted protein VgrG
LDDATGQVRAKLASSSSAAHVHLGYLIDQNDNSRGSYLGFGFDLKSDAWGALRAGRGLYVSTHPAALQPLDAQPANSQLTNATRLIDSLSNAGTAHRAESLQDGHDAMKTFTDATVHAIRGSTQGGRTAGGGTGSANAFAKPLMLLASPAGIGLSTQESVHVSADAQINVVSGQTTHIAAGRSLLASIVEKFSLFVQNAGMKLIAAKGDVQVQAQSGNIDLSAQQALRLASVANNIQLAAKGEILLSAGDGAYIRITGKNIEIHAPGKIDIRGAEHALSGPAQMKLDHPAFPVNMPTTPLMLNTAASPSAAASMPVGMPYKLLADGVQVKQGVVDASGQIPIDHYPTTQQYSVEFANGVTHSIPVPADYHNAANGTLANLGLHAHEGMRGPDGEKVDRAEHRREYASLLNLDLNN